MAKESVTTRGIADPGIRAGIQRKRVLKNLPEQQPTRTLDLSSPHLPSLEDIAHPLWGKEHLRCHPQKAPYKFGVRLS